ncbi:DUF3540 domain-containing protein [Maridesulfovibrio zosterae]|uniref:DUF3540 domain-containing protein n=1 Tax=Maridesulfovibrio zosterae TaxID=82171 RepID=UPI000408F127|nr:DUF3540 domain-containing protein [Maridesulfovibrio zosterae]
MNNLARQQENISPQLEYAKVVAVTETVRVSTSFSELDARRAVSCLVRPEAGDTVLISIDQQGEAWVLSVLIREEQTPTALEVEGDTLLRVKGGSLTVAPDTGLNCITAKAALQSDDIEVAAGKISLTARLFSSNISRVKKVAGTIDDISREFTRRTMNYFRFTKENEECQARSSRQLVEETMTVHSKNTVIVSEEHVKIDGELIHMG